MKKGFLLMLLLWLVPLTAFADSLSSADARRIQAAGIPVYTKAVFVNGSKQAGYRFATGEPVGQVRKWYREKLAQWSLYNEYGSWILYQGKPGAGMGQVFSSNQVSIQRNENLPGWFSLGKDMTTEIVIMLPD